MKKISFEEIGTVAATFYTGEGVERGMAVKMGASETVEPCQAGDRICGVALSVAGDKMGAVQVSGFARVRTEDAAVTPGWMALVADGRGGVKKAATGEVGGEYLVVSTDAVEKTAVVLL